MPELILHIARGGAEVGAFTLEEVKELAEAGFLHHTDDVWFHGMADWRPLEEILGHINAPHGDWRDKVIAGTTALSGVVGRRVGRLVADVKTRAAQGQDAIAQARTIALEQFLPQFQKRAAEYLHDKPAAFAREAVQNDEKAGKMFGAIYDCLPRPLCRFVSETAFVSFCMEHRQKLLGGSAAATVADAPEPSSAPASTDDDAPRT